MNNCKVFNSKKITSSLIMINYGDILITNSLLSGVYIRHQMQNPKCTYDS